MTYGMRLLPGGRAERGLTAMIATRMKTLPLETPEAAPLLGCTPRQAAINV